MKRRYRVLTALLLVFIMGSAASGCGADTDTETGVPPYQIWEPLEPKDNAAAGETDDNSPEQADGAQDENAGQDAAGKDDKGQPGETVSDGNVTITISAAGDVTLGNHQNQEYAYSFRQKYDEEGDAYFLENVKDIFEDDDMTVVNFEGTLTYAEERRETTYNMKGDPSYIQILNDGSVEAVGFANNHCMDYLQKGHDDTVDCFKEAGLTYAYDAVTGIYETKGIKIGLIAVNEVEQGAAVEKIIQSDIDSLREQDADLIVVCCHWGVESETQPEDYQMVLGRKCVDWGADLVLGSHPHVLQGIELYQGKFIVYSLANFCFGGNRNPKDKDTMIFQQQFTFVDGVKQEDIVGRVIPCSVSSVKGLNDFRPTPAEGDEYTRILQKIQDYSSPFGTYFDADGWYVAQ